MKTILILLLSCQLVFGQEQVFCNGKDSNNYYLVVHPKTTPRGLIMILPGYSSTPEGVYDHSDIPVKASKRGYVVIIPYFGETFYLDSIVQDNVKTLIPEVLTKYKVAPGAFVLGGHSAGGNAAMLYAAEAFRYPENNLIKPAAVFGIDPPLDMKRFRKTIIHEIEINYRRNNVQGMETFLTNFEAFFGGSPSLQPKKYAAYSAYDRDAKGGGNTAYLKTVPVRLYCDPDVNWAIENLRVGYEHLNASDQSACIAQLKLLGNPDAELIINLGKGYFGKQRNPHSISQVDANEFLAWVDKAAKAK